jgi:hypothetical protein
MELATKIWIGVALALTSFAAVAAASGCCDWC